VFYEVAKGHGLPHDPVKALVAPRPIGWISALSARGELNLSPYSFFNQVADRPRPLVMFSSAGRKDAVTFVEETGEFVCSVATWDQREPMNATSAPLPRGVSEFEHAGLATEPSVLVRPPRVRGAPAALECRYVKTVPLEPLEGGEAIYLMVIGQVVGVHIDDRLIRDGLVETERMRIIMRAGYHDYFVADTKFSMVRPTRA
jgi:flavin reductase (DIM6/NTAB) family NADH-FMN oxidoreductase RutF